MARIDLQELRERISRLVHPEDTTPVTRRFLEQLERELTATRLEQAQ